MDDSVKEFISNVTKIEAFTSSYKLIYHDLGEPIKILRLYSNDDYIDIKLEDNKYIISITKQSVKKDLYETLSLNYELLEPIEEEILFYGTEIKTRDVWFQCRELLDDFLGKASPFCFGEDSSDEES